MSEITSLARIESIITLSNRRLQPSALSTVTIEDIFAQNPKTLVRREYTGTDKDAKEKAESLYDYLEAEEPTGRERSVESKSAATRYIAIKSMLEVSANAEKPSLRDASLSRIYQWYTSTLERTIKKVGNPTSKIDKAVMLKRIPAAQRPSSHTGIRPSRKAKTKLQSYQKRDLYASHVHRIAQLGSSKSQILSEDLRTEEEQPGVETLKNQDGPRDGYTHYRAETSIEHEMNDIWAQNRQREVLELQNDREVTRVLNNWSRDRGRRDAELLRRQESRMIARQAIRALPEDPADPEEKQENEKQMVEIPTTRAPPQEEEPEKETKRTSRPKAKMPVVIKRQGSGGMRFKNALPPNYSPSPVGPRNRRGSEDKVVKPEPKPVALNSMTAKTGYNRSKVSIEFPHRPESASIRGTIPESKAPLDPELKVFHNALTQRSVSATTLLRAENINANRANTAPSGRRSFVNRRLDEKELIYACSDLRLEQLDEMARIQQALEKHNIKFDTAVFERALLVPEDKPTEICARNLPETGNKLIPNPLLKQKTAVLGVKKKKSGKSGKTKKKSSGKTKKKKIVKKKKKKAT